MLTLPILLFTPTTLDTANLITVTTTVYSKKDPLGEGGPTLPPCEKSLFGGGGGTVLLDPGLLKTGEPLDVVAPLLLGSPVLTSLLPPLGEVLPP